MKNISGVCGAEGLKWCSLGRKNDLKKGVLKVVHTWDILFSHMSAPRVKFLLLTHQLICMFLGRFSYMLNDVYV